MNQRYLHRGISVFFLVFAITDLCCLLQLFTEPPAAQVTFAETSGTITAETSPLLTGASSKQDNHGDAGVEEDCFCCAHVLPAVAHELSSLIIKAVESEPEQAFLPKPPPRNLFHPPRAA